MIKTFSSKNCALFEKERIAILKQSRSNPQLLINSDNKICGACRHRLCFHRHPKQIIPSTDESINDERVSRKHEVATNFGRCNFAWLMSNWKHCEDQQKEIVFHLFPQRWPWKQFQQFAVNQSDFAVLHASN